MKYSIQVLFLLSLNLCANHVLSLRILGLFPYQGKSHFFVFKIYLKELVRRGHDVTVVSHFPDSSSGYTDISLAGTTKIFEDEIPAKRSYLSVIEIGKMIAFTGADNCEKMLELDNVQKLWKSSQKFDLVVTEQFNSDCSLGLAYAMGVPVVGMTSHVLLPFHYSRMGILDNVAFVPFPFFGGGTNPSFYQRIEAVIFRAFFNTMYHLVGQRSNRNTLVKHFGEIPELDELAKEVKFTLLYHAFPLTGSRLLPSNFIEVGGYHVTAPKPLTRELKKFVEEAPHGVVYVSFGSLIKSATLEEDKLQAIIGALSQLKQRVIWKWEDKTLPGNPKNILTMKWLPQNDILAHPNVLAFYSHAGMLGTTEAIHHGVPMVAMPILGDQPSNAAAIRECGLGVYLDFDDLTTETLLAALTQVLQPEFRAKAKDLSRMWHDRPLSAMDTAIFWTEFAARHSYFSFRSPAADVPFYKYYSLDLFAVFMIPLFLILFFLFKYCLRRSRTAVNVRQVKKIVKND